jgi:NHL repeat
VRLKPLSLTGSAALAGANNVVRLVVGASSWILVAGSISASSGSTSTRLNYPRDVTLDWMGNVYVADYNNNRIQFFEAGQSNGTTIAGVAAVTGSNASLLKGPLPSETFSHLEWGGVRIAAMTRFGPC